MRKKVDSNLPKDSSPKKREEVKETKGSPIKSSSDTSAKNDTVLVKIYNDKNQYHRLSST